MANRSLDSVTVYAANGRILATIPAGRQTAAVVVPPGTGKAYVTSEGDNTVLIVSTRTRRLVGTIPVGPQPHHIWPGGDGSRVVFGEYGTNRAGAIDTASDTLTEYVAGADPAARTHQVYPAEDGRTLFAANQVVNEIAAIDVTTGQPTFSVPVGGIPSEVLVSPGGERAYVSVLSEQTVKLVDLNTRTVTREVVVGSLPDTLQLTPDGRTLVVALRGRPAQLVFVDTATFTASAPLTVAGAETVAGHQWLSANGRFTFVAYDGPGAGVAVVDNVTRNVVARYPYPGGGRPHGLYYDDPAASGPVMAVVSRGANVSTRRIARIRVRCGEPTLTECRGRIKLTRGSQELGAGRFAIAAGRAGTARVRLGRPAFRALNRVGRLRARAIATARDGRGRESDVARRVTLRTRRG